MILAIDPSGNFHEGKGITGWTLLDESTGKILRVGSIDASTCLDMESHWKKHLQLVDEMFWASPDLVVIVEDYMLYATKLETQIGSRMETPKLIGVLQYHCYTKGIPIYLQTAVSVKRRWKNFLLAKKGFIEVKPYKKGTKTYEMVYINGFKVNDHIVDSVRHAVHFYHFQSKRNG